MNIIDILGGVVLGGLLVSLPVLVVWRRLKEKRPVARGEELYVSSGLKTQKLSDWVVKNKCTASEVAVMTDPVIFTCRDCGQKWQEGEEWPNCLKKKPPTDEKEAGECDWSDCPVDEPHVHETWTVPKAQESLRVTALPGHQSHQEAAESEAIGGLLLRKRHCHIHGTYSHPAGKQGPDTACPGCRAVLLKPTTRMATPLEDYIAQTLERRKPIRRRTVPLREGVPYAVYPDGSIRERQTGSETSGSRQVSDILVPPQ